MIHWPTYLTLRAGRATNAATVYRINRETLTVVSMEMGTEQPLQLNSQKFLDKYIQLTIQPSVALSSESLITLSKLKRGCATK